MEFTFSGLIYNVKYGDSITITTHDGGHTYTGIVPDGFIANPESQLMIIVDGFNCNTFECKLKVFRGMSTITLMFESKLFHLKLPVVLSISATVKKHEERVSNLQDVIVDLLERLRYLERLPSLTSKTDTLLVPVNPYENLVKITKTYIMTGIDDSIIDIKPGMHLTTLGLFTQPQQLVIIGTKYNSMYKTAMNAFITGTEKYKISDYEASLKFLDISDIQFGTVSEIVKLRALDTLTFTRCGTINDTHLLSNMPLLRTIYYHDMDFPKVAGIDCIEIVIRHPK
jgi:hypothetical protein